MACISVKDWKEVLSQCNDDAIVTLEYRGDDNELFAMFDTFDDFEGIDSVDDDEVVIKFTNY